MIVNATRSCVIASIRIQILFAIAAIRHGPVNVKHTAMYADVGRCGPLLET